MGRKRTIPEASCLHCGKVFRKRSKFCCSRCFHDYRLANPDAYAVSEETKEKLKSIDKSYMQTEEYLTKKTSDHTPAYKKYSRTVHWLTRKVYADHKHEINPHDYPRTLCGVKGGWQLDHIVSIKEGFMRGLPPEKIAKKENLQMLPWEKNLEKRKFPLTDDNGGDNVFFT